MLMPICDSSLHLPKICFLKTELILTGDGSHTLFVPALNEHYHSVHGAIRESMHVFIQAGFMACRQSQINLLEIGFGTGLNAFLTYLESAQWGKEVNYYSYEPFPIEPQTFMQLNYAEQTGHPELRDVFRMMHAFDLGQRFEAGIGFTLHKIKEQIETASLPAEFFHLVYFDAFAPVVQPELWTYEIFRKIFEAMHGNGILVTYSARGEVRRNLVKAGFAVERLPGAPGKREMLRALKCE